MSDALEDFTNVDRLVHEPARFVILSVLDACRAADFVYLQSITKLSNGNLSLHLGKLEAGGLIAIEKKFVRKRPRTTVHLTKDGKKAIRAYLRQFEETRKAARDMSHLRMVADPVTG